MNKSREAHERLERLLLAYGEFDEEFFDGIVDEKHALQIYWHDPAKRLWEWLLEGEK
jgi:hypothetical protein